MDYHKSGAKSEVLCIIIEKLVLCAVQYLLALLLQYYWVSFHLFIISELFFPFLCSMLRCVYKQSSSSSAVAVR